MTRTVPVPGFEWFVAWRHLRDPDRRSVWPLVVGVALLVVGGALLMAAFALTPSRLPSSVLGARPSMLAANLKLAGLLVGGLGLVVGVLGVFCAFFTVFTGISIFGVFLGTGAPIVALSVMSGFEADLKSKIRGAKADVVITSAGDRPFTDWEPVRRRLAGIPGMAASTPYIEAEVMIRSASSMAGVVLKGIDPATAGEVLDLGRTLRQGKMDDLLHPERIPAEPRFPAILRKRRPPAADEPEGAGEESEEPIGPEPPRRLPGILIGEELYEKTLRVFVGSEVDVACPVCGVGPTGAEPRMRTFRVAAHFYSGMYEFDQKLAYVALDEAQRFLGMRGEVTGIEVRTSDPERSREVAAAAEKELGPGYEVRSWEELNRGLFMALKLEKIAMFIALTFIALVASFSIVSNLIMLVTEKAREVAILKSMGARDGGILRIFVAEGLYIGLLGLTVGVTVGVAGCILIARYGLPLDPAVYYIQRLPVVMRAGEIAAVAISALALCCLATVYPAVVASRMRPVDGLRYE